MRLALLLLTLLFVAPSAVAARNILILGDSLSAGYGLRPSEAWPALLAQRLAEKASDYTVVNLSISGETTAGGRARLGAALHRYKPAVVVIELGVNDGLRGLALGQMRANLQAMVDAAHASHARVLLIGMRLPPNYGPYAEQFHASFDEIARRKKTALLDFLLEPVASVPTLFQADGLHPIAKAEPLILDHVWPKLLPLLK